jgi:hypothetical protein
MAKMFYSLDEAASRLGVAANEVRDLVSQGRLQEFRDRDKLMFKVDQVELLAGGDDASDIPLASDQSGSGIPIVLDDKGASGSGIAMEESPKERSGISIFDAEELEQADPSAVTQITQGQGGELTMEAVGSGSGLLDLTREGDDTSLGADLLQDVYGSEGSRAGSGAHETASTSGLFETTGAVSDVSPGMAVGGTTTMVAAEPFDGAGSGLTGGIALGVLAMAAVAMVVVLFGIVGGAPIVADAITGLPAYPWGFIGIGAVAVILFGVIGWAIGRRG